MFAHVFPVEALDVIFIHLSFVQDFEVIHAIEPYSRILDDVHLKERHLAIFERLPEGSFLPKGGPLSGCSGRDWRLCWLQKSGHCH